MADQLTRMEKDLGTFVTRSEFDAYKALQELKDTEQAKDIADLQEAARSKGRMAWTVLIGPVIVGLILFVLQGVAK